MVAHREEGNDMQNAVQAVGVPAAKSASTRPGGDGYGTGVAVLAFSATLGLGAVGWIVSLQRMRGMDMGAATRLGSLSNFLLLWVAMMAAMMLPGTAPLVKRMAGAGSRVRDVSRCLAGYLGIWVALGVAVYALYRPHGAAAAGALTLAAGAYELTPMKRRFREKCRHHRMSSSGLELAFCCAGSSLGLMVMLLALGVMSVTWMAVISAVVLLQKVSRPRAAVDVPVAIAIVALGIAVLAVPSALPGVISPM
jgi:predicted metal-binding membrane protein